jgi:ribosomal protein RSM22 (predicted rRNA methylase)
MARRLATLEHPRLGLVRPLDERFRAAIDAVARARSWPTATEIARLAPVVADLSASYNTEGIAAARLLPARLGFSFARDVPKGAAAAAELIHAGRLAIPADRPLSVLDLGAGLGATTWGLVRALAAAGQGGEVSAVLVDHDSSALAVARELGAALGGDGDVRVTLRAEKRALGSPLARGRHDVVLLGQVLSEDSGGDEDDRAQRHARLLGDLVDEQLVPGGALIVIEPALRDRTRHLQRVRDRLVAAGRPVFAPCPHAAPCPMLPSEADWCHEDLPIDLPEWLVPLARAARLRFQRLTFSYLVIAERTGLEPGGARIVAPPHDTKGKRELVLCHEGALVRATMLDRDVGPENQAFATSARGDVLDVAPLAPRLPRDGRVTRR